MSGAFPPSQPTSTASSPFQSAPTQSLFHTQQSQQPPQGQQQQSGFPSLPYPTPNLPSSSSTPSFFPSLSQHTAHHPPPPPPLQPPLQSAYSFPPPFSSIPPPSQQSQQLPQSQQSQQHAPPSPPSRPDSAMSDRKPFGTPGPEGKKGASKKRQVQSCSECRRRKIKCDRKFPCGPCTLRGDEAICREVEKHEGTTTGCATATSVEILTNRVTHLEAAMKVIQERIPSAGAIIAPSLAAAHEAAMPPRGGKRKAGVEDGNGQSRAGAQAKVDLSPVRDTRRTSDGGTESKDSGDEEEAAVILEDLAFGRRENAALAASKLHLPGQPQMPLNVAHLSYAVTQMHFARRGSTASGTHPTAAQIRASLAHPTFFLVENEASAEMYMRNILATLPDRPKGEALVRLYLRKVDFFHKAIHVPSFLRDLDAFFAISPSSGVTEVVPAFVGLYLIILCLALHFADADEAAQAGFTEEEHKGLPATYFAASRAALWASDYLENHELDNLQTMVLMGLYLNNSGGADTHYSLLGAAIKIAQNMGLSRLGAEPSEDDESTKRGQRKWVGRWASVVTREVGRRIWWNLVLLDWLLAGSHNYSYAIHPDQIHTAYPANISDEDLIDGQPLRPKPMDQHTSMTYQLNRLRFAQLYREIVDQFNASGCIPHKFALEQDKKLQKLIADLPHFYQIDYDLADLGLPPEETQRLHWERILIQLTGQTRLVRLHRPYLAKGYKNKEYAGSKNICVKAARASLALLRNAEESSGFLEKWWIALYFVFASAIVVFIDLCHEKNPHSQEADIKRREMLAALDTLNKIKHVSTGARTAARLIEGLLAEEAGARRATGGTKRKASGDESEGELRRVVKRLMAESANDASSPNSQLSQSPAPAQASSSATTAAHTPPAAPKPVYLSQDTPLSVSPVQTPAPQQAQGFAQPQQQLQGQQAPTTTMPWNLDTLSQIYFPQSGGSGPAPQEQVYTDDLLSRVFEAGSWWDSSANTLPFGLNMLGTNGRSNGADASQNGWGGGLGGHHAL